MTDTSEIRINLADTTAEIVAAYVSHNHVQPNELPTLIRSVHDALGGLGTSTSAAPEPAKLTPPVSIRKSVTDDYLISMEDGKQYQSLKRHLARHGLTPAEYRTKWSLPADYPMTAPSYSARRSELAKNLGLGRKAAQAAPEPAPAAQSEATAPQPEAEAVPGPKRGRKKAA